MPRDGCAHVCCLHSPLQHQLRTARQLSPARPTGQSPMDRASRIGHVTGPHLPNFLRRPDGPTAHAARSFLPFFFFFGCPFRSCVLVFAWRRGEMDAAGRPLPVARMVGPGRPASRTRGLPRQGADRGEASDVWMTGRPPAHASQLPSDALSSLRASWSETGARHAFLAFPLARCCCCCCCLLLLLLLHFLFSLGGSGHGFHWSRVVDPATRQSFLQCLARFQERKLS